MKKKEDAYLIYLIMFEIFTKLQYTFSTYAF